MKFFRSPFSHPLHNSTPIASNMSIDLFCGRLHTEATRFVRKIEICTAVAKGNDFWVAPNDNTHLHTLLRVFLEPIDSSSEASEDVVLIERFLASVGAYHSVTPIIEALPFSGTLLRPDVHDRVCVILDGPSTSLAEHLEVERTLLFGDGLLGDGSSGFRLTLAELGQILEFVSRATRLVCAGGDCKYQSRTFAFACMGALTPRLPPCTLVRKPGESVAFNGSMTMNDSVFELFAMTFLDQVSGLFNDASSLQAVSLLFSDMFSKLTVWHSGGRSSR